MARNPHPEETVARILDVAFDLFAVKGYEHTSIQDIVDHLDGLTKGAIYHHFKSKEEILDAAMARKLAPLAERRARELEEPGRTAAQKIALLFSLDTLADQMRLWDEVGAVLDPVKNARLLAMEYRDTIKITSGELLLPLIEEGLRDGSVRCAYPRQAADALALLGNFWLMPLFGPRGTLEEMRGRIACLVAMGRSLGIAFDERRMLDAAQRMDVFFSEG